MPNSFTTFSGLIIQPSSITSPELIFVVKTDFLGIACLRLIYGKPQDGFHCLDFEA